MAQTPRVRVVSYDQISSPSLYNVVLGLLNEIYIVSLRVFHWIARMSRKIAAKACPVSISAPIGSSAFRFLFYRYPF